MIYFAPFSSFFLKKIAASVIHCFGEGRPRSILKVFLTLKFQKPKPSGELREFTNINRVALKKYDREIIHPRLKIYPGEEIKATATTFQSTQVSKVTLQNFSNPTVLHVGKWKQQNVMGSEKTMQSRTLDFLTLTYELHISVDASLACSSSQNCVWHSSVG